MPRDWLEPDWPEVDGPELLAEAAEVPSPACCWPPYFLFLPAPPCSLTPPLPAALAAEAMSPGGTEE